MWSASHLGYFVYREFDDSFLGMVLRFMIEFLLRFDMIASPIDSLKISGDLVERVND